MCRIKKCVTKKKDLRNTSSNCILVKISHLESSDTVYYQEKEKVEERTTFL